MGKVSQEKKGRVLAEWARWEEQTQAQGVQPNQTSFLKASMGTHWETNMSTLRNYIGKNPERRIGSSPKQVKDSVMPSTGPNPIHKQIQELQAAYRLQSLADCLNAKGKHTSRGGLWSPTTASRLTLAWG